MRLANGTAYALTDIREAGTAGMCTADRPDVI